MCLAGCLYLCTVHAGSGQSSHANRAQQRRSVQAMRACEADKECFAYHIEERNVSASAIAALPGVAAAAMALGYRSLQEYEADAVSHIEAVYAVSTFCLTPPGDTPKRKGIHDAWNMGCIPVVFDEHSRELKLYLSADESAAITVFMPPNELLSISEAASGGIGAKLRELAPDVAAIRDAIAAKVTRLHFAYSDLGAEDHAAVGPDALDVLLHGLAAQQQASPRGAVSAAPHSSGLADSLSKA